MSNTWYTSDTHFGHKNIISHCDRPFDSVEEMDEALIDNWNSTVTCKDTVYHLGDVAFGNKEKLSRLNGDIYLILGNHDHNNKKELCKYLTILDDLIVVDHTNRLVLCHYPLYSWPYKNKGYSHLHGHMHGTVDYNLDASDVGVDSWRYKPTSLNQIRNRIRAYKRNEQQERSYRL